MSYTKFLNKKVLQHTPSGFTPGELKVVYIYALIDPETQEIRYIGKSVHPEARLQSHCNEKSNCHRSHWLQSLKQKGLKPSMMIIQEIIGDWPWQEAERYWIAYAKHYGNRLTNNTSGGDGVPDLPQETKERMRLTWVGRKHTEEAKKKIGAATRQRRHSHATKLRMSKAHTGRMITNEWRAKLAIAVSKFTPQQVITIQKELLQGYKVHELATKYQVHRTTISKIKKGTYRNAA